MATMLPGVRPSISLASLPTASTSPVFLLMATIEGSLTTIPLPRAYTHVLAVPRSMARSLEKSENSEPRPNVRHSLQEARPPEQCESRPCPRPWHRTWPHPPHVVIHRPMQPRPAG